MKKQLHMYPKHFHPQSTITTRLKRKLWQLYLPSKKKKKNSTKCYMDATLPWSNTSPSATLAKQMHYPDSSLHKLLLEDTVFAAVSVKPEVVSALVSTARTLPVTPEMILEATTSDLLSQKFLHFHSINWATVCAGRQLQSFLQYRSLSEVNGIIQFLMGFW